MAIHADLFIVIASKVSYSMIAIYLFIFDNDVVVFVTSAFFLISQVKKGSHGRPDGWCF